MNEENLWLWREDLSRNSKRSHHLRQKSGIWTKTWYGHGVFGQTIATTENLRRSYTPALVLTWPIMGKARREQVRSN
jgi:hypothetical protein